MVQKLNETDITDRSIIYEVLGRKINPEDEFKLDLRKLGLRVDLSDDDQSSVED